MICSFSCRPASTLTLPPLLLPILFTFAILLSNLQPSRSASTPHQHFFSPLHPSSSPLPPPISSSSSSAQPPSPLALRHAGLYINHPHSPLYHKPPPSSSSPPLVPTKPLTLFIDDTLYDPTSAIVTLGALVSRDRDQVMLGCGASSDSDLGGIEACILDDTERSKSSHNRSSSHLTCRPTHHPSSVKPDGRFILDAKSCPGWDSYWSSRPQARSDRSTLDSLAVSLDILPLNRSDRTETNVWWLGHLNLLESDRASWPFAGNARTKYNGQEEVWTGRTVNRISGAMESPFIPRANKGKDTDPNRGVYVQESSWNLGVSIRVPLLDRALGREANDSSGEATWRSTSNLLQEDFHAPVGGQVVWSRPYKRKRPPLSGPGEGMNDEEDWCLMIRDEWSLVHQIFGLDPSSLRFEEGDYFARGQVLGGANRVKPSSSPPSTLPPADPPSEDDTPPQKGSPLYPYRFKRVEIRVARPHPSWTEWKRPEEPGWEYFHPLHVYREADFRSTIPPEGAPMTIFFADPSPDPLGTPPVSLSSTNDFFRPSLSGRKEMIVGLAYFQETPNFPEDGLDPLGIYALEWAIRKVQSGDRKVDPNDACDVGNRQGEEVDWRSSFEFSKLTHQLSPILTRNKAGEGDGATQAGGWRRISEDQDPRFASIGPDHVFSHLVPSFKSGRFLPTWYASQSDEKASNLFYSLNRNSLGQPSLHGHWDVEREVGGDHMLVVRSRDYWGNVGCIRGQVYLS
ncbi:hypothetical protein IE53DRAFT_386132 [Violaceomyces palustris]|uniref:Uncharacterized protein n=1 Tax=Violaceomyces palustris TaxID=1673888 RepID=A0ACD0P0F6_9BASI|nr:hypothetical protein IE53DRAFT_386132 [Violaceomyces palustris]